MQSWKTVIVFSVGGLLYTGLELCWRGWTHGSMFLLGGVCFRLLWQLSRAKLSFLSQMLLGMAGITALELTSGLLLNRLLHMNVWDYSAMPCQLLGQICLNYSLLWLPVSAAGLLSARGLRRALGERPAPIRWA